MHIDGGVHAYEALRLTSGPRGRMPVGECRTVELSQSISDCVLEWVCGSATVLASAGCAARSILVGAACRNRAMGKGAGVSSGAARSRASGGGGKKRKGAPEPDDSGSKRSRPAEMGSECLACGEALTKDNWCKVNSDSCNSCLMRWLRGFSMGGNFEAVCAKIADETSDIAKQWSEAMQKESGSSSTELESKDIFEESGVEINVTRSLVGIPRADLIQVMGGATPEDAGIKLETLKNEQGETFRGLLVINPQRPWVEYEVKRKLSATQRLCKLAAADQLYEAHGEKTYNFTRQDVEKRQDNALVMTKLRTLPFDTATLKARGAALMKTKEDEKKGEPSLQATVPCADSAEDEQSSSNVVVSAAVSAAFGKALNRKAVAESVAGDMDDDAKIRRNAKCSPGTKPRKPASLGKDGTQQEGPRDTLSRKIRALNINFILTGEKGMGREIYWARTALTTFMEEGNSNEANVLSHHIDTAEKAELLMATPTPQHKAETLAACLTALHEAGQEHPTNLKHQLLKRRVAELTSNKETDMQAFLQVVLPWRAKFHDGEFDPLAPRLAEIEGSPVERGNSFETSVLGMLTALVQQGESAKDRLLSATTAVVEFLDEHAIEDEDEGTDAESFDEVVGKLLCCVQAVQCLADPWAVEFAQSLQQLDKLTSSSSAETKLSAPYALAIALKKSDYWARTRAAFDANLDGTRKHKKYLLDMTHSMREMGSSDLVVNGKLKGCLGRLPQLVGEVREGLCGELQTSVEDKLMEYCASFSFSEGEGESVQLLSERFSGLKELLELAGEALPHGYRQWAKYSQQCVAAHAKMERSLKEHDFVHLADLMADLDWCDVGRVKALQVSLGELLKTSGQEQIALSQDFDARIAAVVNVIQKAKAPMEVRDLCDLWGQALAGKVLGEAIGKDLAMHLEFVGDWSSLYASLAVWQSLGESTAERVEKDSDMNAIKKMVGACAVVRRHSDGDILKLPHLFADLERGLKELEDIRQAVVGAAMAGLMTDCAELRDVAGGGAGGISWTANISEKKATDESHVIKACRDTLLSMKGAEFDAMITSTQAKLNQAKAVHELFNTNIAPNIQKECDDILAIAKATKYTALLIARHDELSTNAPKLARAIKKVRQTITDTPLVMDKIHPIVWAWSGRFVRIGGSAAK